MPQIDEIDDPGGGDVLEVTMGALNPVDISIGSGRFYGGSPPTPYVIGSEAGGRTADGRRVWYNARGAIAERVVLGDPEHVVEIPDGADDETAVACGLDG